MRIYAKVDSGENVQIDIMQSGESEQTPHYKPVCLTFCPATQVKVLGLNRLMET